MNEREFAARFFESYKVKGDEIIPRLCPFCHGGDHHKDKETFALNMEKHTYNCMRGSCGAQGHFSQLCREYGVEQERDKPYMPPVKRSYIKPKVDMQPGGGAMMAYIQKRGITEDTAKAFGIREDKDGNMVFPYYRTPEDYAAQKPTFMKYRRPCKIESGQRKMWREKDTEPILFGMHLCDDRPILYICEGEFDAMCCRQVSGANCVSVPSGCEDFTWLETCYEWLKRFTAVVIMADNDAAGHKMLRELSLKLDCEVRRPDFETYLGCKDSNEILARHGTDKLLEAMTRLRTVEIQGLLNLADVQHIDLDKLPRVMSGIASMDKATGGLFMGDLSVWTGKRGEGKSTILTQLLLNAVESGYNVCAYSGEVPADRFKYIVNLQAAGSAFASEREDKITGRMAQYVSREHLDKIEAWYNGRFWLYDNKIIEADESDSIMKTFELAYKRYNCRVFLVDNLMTAMTCRSDADYYHRQADLTIKLRKLAEKLGVHVHLVAHPRKGSVTDSDDVGGSSAVTDIACNVFKLRRVPDDKRDTEGCDATLACLKNRAYGENTAVKLEYMPRCRRFTEWGYEEKPYSWSRDEYVVVGDAKDLEDIAF